MRNNNNNKCLDRLKLKASRKHGKALRPGPGPGPGLGPNCYRTRSPGVVLSGFPSLGRVTTLVPFPDLNLTPDCETSSAAGVPGVAVPDDRRNQPLVVQAPAEMKKHIVGSIPGIEIGDVFYYRQEMCVVGLHGQPHAGIDYIKAQRSSKGEPIATSIVVSGGYEDDEDTGDVLVYSGHGGQDKLRRHRQCRHQELTRGNLAMERSFHHGIEVRVIRGIKYRNRISSQVYIYDGLYRISDWWLDTGKSGFRVYKFRLVRIKGQPEMGSAT